MDVKHSPLPWKIGNSAGYHVAWITDANDDVVAQTSLPLNTRVEALRDLRQQPAFAVHIANAELIVATVNATSASQ